MSSIGELPLYRLDGCDRDDPGTAETNAVDSTLSSAVGGHESQPFQNGWSILCTGAGVTGPYDEPEHLPSADNHCAANPPVLY